MGTYDTHGGAPISPDVPDPPCEVCGESADHCTCAECPVCSVQGDPDCAINGGKAAHCKPGR